MSLAAALKTGAELHNAGRLQDAANVYRDLIDNGHAGDATLNHLLALVLDDQGDLPSALACCDNAIRAGHPSSELLFTRAEVLRKLGRLGEAALAYDRLLGEAPTHGRGQLHRGVALAGLGRLSEALLSYNAAAALDPSAPKVFNNRGAALEALGRLKEALADYDQALSLDARYGVAFHNRGSVLSKLGRLPEALESFNRALAIREDIPEIWNFRGVVLERLGQHQQALESFDRTIQLRPTLADAWNNRSACLRGLARFADAQASAEQALRLRPDFAEAYNSLGSALVKTYRLEQAVQAYQRSLALKPNDPAVHHNLGLALEMQEDLDAALASFDAARRLDPGAPEPIYSSALAHIRRGDLQEGFRGFEVRWRQKDGPELRYPPETLWLGEQEVAGRRVLVHGEQGFGDVLQFCRFATVLAERGAKVELEVQPALVRLLASLKGVSRVRPFAKGGPDFDLHVPVMSLVVALNLRLDALSPTIPYLSPPEEVVELWRARLPAADALRVGLAWSGNPKHSNDAERSIALERLSPLLSLDAEFVALQREFRADDLAFLGASKVKRFDDQLLDFAHTAALVQRCDVVVAVDTSVAHLAGALGKPVLLLAPKHADWRWMVSRSDTPWYPSFEVLRQHQFGDWTEVVAVAKQRLEALLPAS